MYNVCIYDKLYTTWFNNRCESKYSTFLFVFFQEQEQRTIERERERERESVGVRERERKRVGEHKKVSGLKPMGEGSEGFEDSHLLWNTTFYLFTLKKTQLLD